MMKIDSVLFVVVILVLIDIGRIASKDDDVMLLSGMGSYKCGKKIQRNKFRIAVLYQETSDKTHLPILKSIKDLAMSEIEILKQSGKLSGLRNHSFSIFFHGLKSGPHGVAGILRTFFQYILDEPVHAFIGPDKIIPLGTVARMSGSRFNRSLISMGAAGFQNEFQNSREYKGLTRIVGSHESLLKFVTLFLSRYNYSNIGIMYIDDRQYNNYYYLAKELQNQLPFRVLGYKVDMKNIENIRYNLKLLSNQFRVILISGSEENVRKVLLQTSHINGDISEYVFIHIDLFGRFNPRPWYDPKSAENTRKLKRICRQFFFITLPSTNQYWHSRLASRLRRLARINHNVVFRKEKLDFLATAFYESFILYALALNDTYSKGDSLTHITNYMWNRTFMGFMKLVNINENGTRNSDFAIFDMDKNDLEMKQIGFYNGSLNAYRLTKPIDWGTKDNKAPPNEPKCGYEGEKCKKNKTSLVLIVVICFVVLFVVGIIGGLFGYRHIKFQAELKMMNWQIPWDLLDTYEKRLDKRRATSALNSSADDGKRLKKTSRSIAYGDVDGQGNDDLEVEFQKGGGKRKRKLSTKKMDKIRAFAGKKDSVSQATITEEQEEDLESGMLMTQQRNDDGSSLDSHEDAHHLVGEDNEDGEHQHHKKNTVRTALYKDGMVVLKRIRHLKKIEASKVMLLEIKKVKDLTNDHICRFIGLCVDPGHLYFVYEHCPKGSLEDVLNNDQINLDWMFRFSLIQDIVRGMVFLHGNYGPHGRLKSSNCVVDSRFVLKLTDFGLRNFRKRVHLSEIQDESEKEVYYKDQLWTSPELLRQQNMAPVSQSPVAMEDTGTVKGDVYSFSIICQEILYRRGVFYSGGSENNPREENTGNQDNTNNNQATPPSSFASWKELVQMIMHGSGAGTVVRPRLEAQELDTAMPNGLVRVITDAWEEDANLRPDFTAIRNSMRKFSKGKESGNILDNLLSRMEQYANNLEGLVAQRTQEYLEEKKKAENLLYSMLPRSVAHQLIKNQSVSAETYDQVTIYFSDIVGFTSLSADSSPMQVIDLLNHLYTTFDSIIENYDVYKVETIGDAYMVVSGLPNMNGNLHAREISRMSLNFLSAIFKFKIPHRPDIQLKLRIGVHSGFVCAGVVGLKMPRYCLFGDTVNTASRMESNGLPLKIHISETTKNVLTSFKTFVISERGEVEMKGKGKQLTFWLHGENDVIIDPVPEDAKMIT